MKRCDPFGPAHLTAGAIVISDDAIVLTCPHCLGAPLRFVSSGNCADSTGGGTYTCSACSYSTARDKLVTGLLLELRDVKLLLEEFVELAIPRLARCRCRPDAALDGLRDLAEIVGAVDPGD
jgi:hypothetical protein